MRALLVIPAAVVAMVLGALSVPWFLWGAGLFALGEWDAADRVANASPLFLFFDYVERHRERAGRKF